MHLAGPTSRDRPSEPGLDDLLEEARRGDMETFARLYDATVAYVYAMALAVDAGGGHAQSPSLRDARARRVTMETYRLVRLYCSRYDRQRYAALPWIGAVLRGAAVSVGHR